MGLVGCVALGLVLVLSCIPILFGVFALVVAYTDGGNPCQGDDVTGVDLKLWLLVYGWADVAAVLLFDVLTAIIILPATEWAREEFTFKDKKAFLRFLTMLNIVGFTWMLVKTGWTLFGAVLAARGQSGCMTGDSSLGAMMYAIFVFEALKYPLLCLNHKYEWCRIVWNEGKSCKNSSNPSLQTPLRPASEEKV